MTSNDHSPSQEAEVSGEESILRHTCADGAPDPILTESPAPSALVDLLARVEAAEGPDRGLDVFIAQAVEPPTDMLNGMVFNEAIEKFPHDLAGIANHWPVIPFTASLDAALDLVERVLPDWFVGLQQNRHRHRAPDWSAYVERSTKNEFEATAPTPALALIAAMLKALIANGQDGPTDRPALPRETQSLQPPGGIK